ncbi:MAG: dTMP kinase [Phycisphaerales bacterium]
MRVEVPSGLAGKLIVVDGPDGSGKSTQFRRLASAARDSGLTVCEVREPGGTRIGEAIRQILLDPRHTEMDIRTEMLLYMASRAQLVHERILPALSEGQMVLADRFVSSTIAYQGTAGGIGIADIRAAAQIACAYHDSDGTHRILEPHLTLLYDVDERTAARRLNPLLDRMEQKGEAFHRRVRQGFLLQAAQDPRRWGVIDASRPEHEVAAATLSVLNERFG